MVSTPRFIVRKIQYSGISGFPNPGKSSILNICNIEWRRRRWRCRFSNESNRYRCHQFLLCTLLLDQFVSVYKISIGVRDLVISVSYGSRVLKSYKLESKRVVFATFEYCIFRSSVYFHLHQTSKYFTGRNLVG